MTSRMVERVARAIHDGPLCGGSEHTFDGPSSNEQEASNWCREVACAAIAAMSDPTEAMIEAANIADRGMMPWADQYRAMIDAALREEAGCG